MLSDPDQEIIFGPPRDRGVGVSGVIYIVGCALLIVGVVYGGIRLNVPLHWVVVCATVLLGFSLVNAPKILRYKNADDEISDDLDDGEARYYHRPRSSPPAVVAPVKLMQQPVQRRRQQNARHNQENQSGVQGIEAGEEFPAVGDWHMHRPHAAEQHGGVQKSVTPH